jgi:hypothetical protein
VEITFLGIVTLNYNARKNHAFHLIQALYVDYCTDIVRLPNDGAIMVVSSVYPRVVAPKVETALYP